MKALLTKVVTHPIIIMKELLLRMLAGSSYVSDESLWSSSAPNMFSDSMPLI